MSRKRHTGTIIAINRDQFLANEGVTVDGVLTFPDWFLNSGLDHQYRKATEEYTIWIHDWSTPTSETLFLFFDFFQYITRVENRRTGDDSLDLFIVEEGQEPINIKFSEIGTVYSLQNINNYALQGKLRFLRDLNLFN